MSDPRDFRSDPLHRDDLNRPMPAEDYGNARSSNAMWGWIAGIVFVVVVMALIFSPGFTGDSQTALNNEPAANSVTVAPPTGAQPPAPVPAPSTTGQGTPQ